MEERERTITVRAPTWWETYLYLEECKLNNGGFLAQSIEPISYDLYTKRNPIKAKVIEDTAEVIKELREKFNFKFLEDGRENTNNS